MAMYTDPLPKTLKRIKVLQFRLMEQGLDDRKHNVDINQKRAKQLERVGAYRVEEPISKFERSFKPRFSDKVHQVDRIEGGEGGGRRWAESSHKVRTGSTCRFCAYGAS